MEHEVKKMEYESRNKKPFTVNAFLLTQAAIVLAILLCITAAIVLIKT